MNPTEIEILLSIQRRKDEAKHGSHRDIDFEGAQLLGCSVNTLHRKLGKLVGAARKKRKTRADSGTFGCTVPELELVSGFMMAGSNLKGQMPPIATVIDILFAAGKLRKRLHPSTFSRQLYAHGLHPKQLMLPSACIEMQSDGAGHLSQMDSTTGIYYYMPGGKLRFMPEDEYYKNKPANLVRAATDLVTRMTWVDHASGLFKAWHYLGGETVENVLDFMVRCIWKQDSSPMHGVPQILLTDPGAANRSKAVRNFCRNVGIDLRHHAPGAARVTGSVEKTHDLIRMGYETRLRFVDPKEVTLDKLNAELEQWTAYYCATRKHTRHGMTRASAWMRIKPERLRVPASLEVLRQAAHSEPETRKVSNKLTISYEGKEFDVADVPGVVAGLPVTLQINVFRAPAIDVRFTCPDTSEETWHVVEPVVRNDWGFRVDSPVWGEEPRTAKQSNLDRNRNRLSREAYKTGETLPTLEEAARLRRRHAQAYAGVFDVMADVKAAQLPTYLPRRSTPLTIASPKVELPRFPLVQCCMLIMNSIGKRWQPAMRKIVEERITASGSDGLLETEVAELARELGADPAPAAQRAAL